MRNHTDQTSVRLTAPARAAETWAGPAIISGAPDPQARCTSKVALQPAHWWPGCRELVNRCCWFQDTALQSGLLHRDFQTICNSLHRFIMSRFCLFLSALPSDLFRVICGLQFLGIYGGSLFFFSLTLSLIPLGFNFLHSARSASEFPLPNCHCQFWFGIMSSPIFFWTYLFLYFHHSGISANGGDKPLYSYVLLYS